MDLIDYNDSNESQGFILFLDFYKGFDMMKQNFMIQFLEYFGFEEHFLNLIKTSIQRYK